MRVLYLFSGTRKEKLDKILSGQYPNTQLYGFNYLNKFGIHTETKELPFNFLSFRIKHFLSYFLIKKYDIVFGSSLLYLALWQKIFHKKTKFVLLNISLNRTLFKNKNKTLRLKFIKSLIKEFTLIICLSSYQRDELINDFNLPANKIIFTPLGVDTQFYEPVFKNRQDYILSVGRDNGRDYQTLIKVAQQIPQQKFILICSRRNLAGITSIPENVKVIFDLPINKLKQKYQQAKLLLLTTHPDGYQDGSDCSGQTVLLDVFACGLPVIATRKQYLADYTEDKENVLLTKPYDVNDIINKIRILSADDEYRLVLAKKARQKVEQSFTTYKMAQNLSIIFKKL